MVPVLGFKRGAPHLTLGAPGGRKIVSAVPQVIANLVDGRAGPQAAIDAPRLHTEGGPLEVDARVGDRALADLRRRGHDVLPRDETYTSFHFARPIGVRITPRGLEAGLDSLGAAAAAGH
jgi:gamma-glutamyltranspeptidase/glutathione hydrolase